MLSWEKDPLLRDYVIKLLNALALYTPHKLKQHLHHVLPIMLKSLKSVCKKKQEFEYKPGEILHFLETCGSTLNDHLDLLIPGFIDIFEQMDGLQRIRIQVSLSAHSSACWILVMCVGLPIFRNPGRISANGRSGLSRLHCTAACAFQRIIVSCRCGTLS